jgi:hypothetical protein
MIQALKESNQFAESIGVFFNVLFEAVAGLEEADSVSSEDVEDPFILDVLELDSLSRLGSLLASAVIDGEVSVYALGVEKLLIRGQTREAHTLLFNRQSKERSGLFNSNALVIRTVESGGTQ